MGTEIGGYLGYPGFKGYPIGFFHIDIAEVRTEDGKLHLFVVIDRTSKLALAELHEKATRRVAADFLRRLIEAVPYRIHTVLTDNGTHFTEPSGDGWSPADILRMLDAGETFRCHAFELACAQAGVEHRLTRPNHPWTNGQVERMNNTLKEATVRRYHYETHDALRAHLKTFLDAHNFAKRLKTLKGRTVFEFITEKWTAEPQRFKLHPNHLSPGPNNLTIFTLTVRLPVFFDVVSAFFCGERSEQLADRAPWAFDRAFGGLGEQRLELGEGSLERIEIG